MNSFTPNTESECRTGPTQVSRCVARLLILMALLLASCGSPTNDETANDGDVNSSADDAGSGTDGGQSDSSSATDTDTGNPNLVYTPQSGDVICNGDREVIGEISNAKANESLDFDAPDSPFVLVGDAKANGTMQLYWKCLPSEGNREWTILVTGRESHRDVTVVVVGRLPPPAKPGGIVVDIVEKPFSCDDEERVLATFENLTPNVEVDFDVQPAGIPIIDDRAGEDGILTIRWRCTTADVPTSWLLTLHESTPEPRRRTSFRFNATDDPYQPPADIEIFEDPFICDGEVREFALVSKFIPGEFVRFTSPQTDNLRGGNADENGNLQIRWQCDPDQADFRWKVTATGGSSLATVTFDITGAAAE